MITWLPRRLTSTNPRAASNAQTSRPERTRSLGNPDLDLRYVHFGVKTLRDFLGRCALEEELKRFLEVRVRLLDRIALTRDIELGTERDIAVAFPLDDRG